MFHVVGGGVREREREEGVYFLGYLFWKSHLFANNGQEVSFICSLQDKPGMQQARMREIGENKEGVGTHWLR